MKKILLFVAVVTAASFASCKKDRSCTCTGTSTTTTVTTWDNSPTTETEVTSDPNSDVVIFNEAKKKDAKKACIDYTNEDVYSYSSAGVNPDGNFDTNENVATTKSENTCKLN